MASTLLIAIVIPVDAAASCNPGRVGDYDTSHFAAWNRTPNASSVGGAYGNIYLYEPYVAPVCSIQNPCDNTLESIGVVNGAQTWIAQTGWKIYEYGLAVGIRDFCEYYPGVIHDSYIDNNVGAVVPFGILYGYNHNSSGQPIFTCQKNGSTFDTLNYTTQPNGGQVFGEVHTFASQMAGGTNTNDYITNLHLWFNNGWQPYGAHAPGQDPLDQQCVSDTVQGLLCAVVGGSLTRPWYGGSDFNSNVFGTNVFDNSTQDQLNMTDLGCAN